MPTLYVLAGANGAGKTTYYFSGLESGVFPSDLPFVNVDITAKQQFGGYSESQVSQAEEFVKKQMSALISARADFMIESNLAKASEFEWLQKIKDLGYTIVMDFISTGEVSLNKDRVHRRLIEGGHDVPDHIIEQRASMAVTYLKSKVFLFDEIHFIDNSTMLPEVVAVTKLGKIVSMNANCPEWTKQILSIAMRLQEKKGKGNHIEEPPQTSLAKKRTGRRRKKDL